MNRAIIVLGLGMLAVSAYAQPERDVVFEKPFRPASPVVVGQGGSFTANGYGFDAFFTNPAAMAGKGSFTLLSVNPWLYSTGDMLQFVFDTTGSEDQSDTGGKGIAARVLPDGWVTIEVQPLPPGFVLPPEYTGTQAEFEAELEDLLNETIAAAAEEFDPAVLAALQEDGLTIPASWSGIDVTSLESESDLAQYLPDFLDANPGVGNAIAGPLLDELLPGFPRSPKLRVGVAAGLGLIVRGFGLGFAAILDANVQGDTVLSTRGDVTFTVGFMAGYAHRFQFSDSFDLRVGALLRPMFRIDAPVTVSALLGALSGGGIDPMALLDKLYARYGTGIGIDVGAIVGLGPFSVGLSITDLFDTRFNYRQTTFRTLYDEFMDGDDQALPDGEELGKDDPLYAVPMDVRLGAAFHPNLGGLSFLFDPTIHLEIGNVLTVARKARIAAQKDEEYTVRLGDIAAIGAEIRLLRILAVRAGYYQGAFSAGLGAHLLFLDANVAAYIAPKAGVDVGSGDSAFSDFGDIGLTAEIALRF